MNEQQTPEYWQSKIGCVGASKITAVMSQGKGGQPSKTRAAYMGEIIAARLSGQYPKSYQSAAMTRGIELEEEAREVYSFFTGNEVETCGFIMHPTIDRAGASPDGLIGLEGCLEIKCPDTHTHIEYLLKGIGPATYKKQRHWQLDCAERKWSEFVSYCPDLPQDLQLFIHRENRNEELITDMRDAVILFNEDVADKIHSLEIISRKGMS